LNEDAEVAVDKALAIDPNLAEGYFARGLMLWTPSKRFPHEQAVQAYKRASTTRGVDYRRDLQIRSSSGPISYTETTTCEPCPNCRCALRQYDRESLVDSARTATAPGGRHDGCSQNCS
jgi:hypothetical protein